MYKVTLFDENAASCCSSTFSCYCDFIEEFERAWLALGQDEGQAERFRRSKAGELVTDYYNLKDPALNIVQYDPETVVYLEHVLTKEDLRMTARNAYDWPSTIVADHGEFRVRYVKFQGEYLKLVKYKLSGVCKLWSEEENIYKSLSCYGNKILILKQEKENERSYLSKDRSVYQNDTVESIAYYAVEKYETWEDMQQAYREPGKWFTEMELVRLLEDIPGEAG